MSTLVISTLSLVLGCFSLSASSFGAEKSSSVLQEFSPSKGVRIAYRDVGPKTGATLLLIHGFPLSMKMWDAALPRLSKTNRVISVDLRGFGKSTDASGQYTLELMVDDLFALLDHLKVEKVTPVGFSMGGYVALRAIARDPSKFSSLILVDTKSEADSDEAKIKRTGALKTIQSKGVREYASQFLTVALSTANQSKDSAAYRLALEISSQNSVKGLAGGVLAMISRTDTTSALAQISVPTLLVVGAEDQVTPAAGMKAMGEKIKNSRFVIIPNAGHLSPLEAPEKFSEIVSDFLSSK